MGKGKQLKKIRKVAAQMPVIPIKKVLGERFMGHELIKVEAMAELPDGTEIDPDKVYTKKKLIDGVLNHERQMKRLYNKHGESGVIGYIKAAADYARELELKASK